MARRSEDSVDCSNCCVTSASMGLHKRTFKGGMGSKMMDEDTKKIIMNTLENEADINVERDKKMSELGLKKVRKDCDPIYTLGIISMFDYDRKNIFPIFNLIFKL